MRRMTYFGSTLLAWLMWDMMWSGAVRSWTSFSRGSASTRLRRSRKSANCSKGITSNGDSARSECWHVLIRNRAMMATDGPDLLDDELCSWKNSPKKFRLIWPVPYSRNPGSTRLLDSTLTAQAAANQKGTR